ncbi:amidohydrolase family protein [Sphingomonas sp.]|uniref:metal-dependent hydrolase family protein n=1 Tax=Sphingomonas sp. TaxID=28214 RepID=UPI002869F69C|nr:amidohydrolase family protein [Sphingomonas sp.]
MGRRQGVGIGFLGLAALAAAPPPQPPELAIHVGHLIDPERGLVDHDRLVVLRDGKIASVGAWGGHERSDALDWSARWVLPGLIDMHTHVADGFGSTNDPAEPLKHSAEATILKGAEAARIMLHSGFTTVRDVGVYRGLSDVALRDAIAAGQVEGPRMIVAGGYITISGGGGAVTGAPKGTVIGPEFRIGEAHTPAEARRRVRLLIDGGADFIKLIASGAVLAIGSEPGALELTPAMQQAACNEAKARGRYCIAHAHGAEAIKVAIRAGARTIEHASLIDDEGLMLAKQRGVWLDMDIFNGDWIEQVGTREGWPAEYLRKNRDTTDVQRQGFAKAVKLGVKLTFGTDAAVYPFGLGARQFAYMTRFGMVPMQAIAAATSEAAKALGQEGKLGSVRPGAAGDLVAVDADPVADIAALRCISDVVQAGRLVHRADAAQRCDRP